MRHALVVALLAALVGACGETERAPDATDVVEDGADTAEILTLSPVSDDHPWPSRARVPFLSLDGDWDFAADPLDAGLTAGWAAGAGEAAPFAERIRVPFPPESRGAFADGTPRATEAVSVAWYRVHFHVGGDWASRRAFVVFLGVQGHATAWLNGREIGEHHGGYAPFELEATDALIDGDNALLVRTARPAVDDDGALVGLQPVLGGVSGIWRSVYVELRGRRWTGPVEIGPASTPAGSARPLGLTVRADLRGDADGADGWEVVLQAANGRTGSARGALGDGDLVTATVSLDGAEDWSPARPTVVQGALRLTRAGAPVDEQRFSFGLREADTGWCPGLAPGEGARGEDAPAAAGCLRVDGHPVYVRALTYHAYDPWHLGSCPAGSCEADLRAILELGFNAVRVRGTTLPPRVLAEADALGLVVLADVPGFSEHAGSPLASGGAAAYEAQLDELLPVAAPNPSVVSWSLFQGEAGLLHPPFWHDSPLTDWLVGLVSRARSLARRALIEDNVAGGFSLLLDGSQPHVQTDVQSYLVPRGSLADLDTWLDELETLAVPGSSWNFVGATPASGQPILAADASCRPGSVAGAPLAGCLPELLTRLRARPRLAGFSLAALRDAPGGIVGLLDASGRAKGWGYDAFGFELPALLGPDFVLLEPPLVRAGQPATPLTLAVGLATGNPGARDGLVVKVEAFFDTCTVTGKPTRDLLWTRELALPDALAFGPNTLGSLDLTTPLEPGVVTVLARLVDQADGTRAANRLQVVVPGACQRAPADEPSPDVVVPLGATWNGTWSAGWGYNQGSTVSGYGSGYFKWDLYTDLAYQLANVERFALVFEAAPLPQQRPLPQTDAERLPGRGWCRIFPEGAKTWFEMADVYADARGVLSGLNVPDFDWASGDLVRLDIPIDRIGEPWQGVIRVECGVDPDPDWGHGLRIFDEAAGRWPLRPALLAWKKKR